MNKKIAFLLTGILMFSSLSGTGFSHTGGSTGIFPSWQEVLTRQILESATKRFGWVIPESIGSMEMVAPLGVLVDTSWLAKKQNKQTEIEAKAGLIEGFESFSNQEIPIKKRKHISEEVKASRISSSPFLPEKAQYTSSDVLFYRLGGNGAGNKGGDKSAKNDEEKESKKSSARKDKGQTGSASYSPALAQQASQLKTRLEKIKQEFQSAGAEDHSPVIRKWNQAVLSVMKDWDGWSDWLVRAGTPENERYILSAKAVSYLLKNKYPELVGNGQLKLVRYIEDLDQEFATLQLGSRMLFEHGLPIAPDDHKKLDKLRDYEQVRLKSIFSSMITAMTGFFHTELEGFPLGVSRAYLVEYDKHHYITVIVHRWPASGNYSVWLLDSLNVLERKTPETDALRAQWLELKLSLGENAEAIQQSEEKLRSHLKGQSCEAQMVMFAFMSAVELLGRSKAEFYFFDDRRQSDSTNCLAFSLNDLDAIVSRGLALGEWSWKGQKSKSARFVNYLWSSVLRELMEISAGVAVGDAEMQLFQPNSQVNAESVYQLIQKRMEVTPSVYDNPLKATAIMLISIGAPTGRAIIQPERATFTHDERFVFAKLTQYPYEMLAFTQSDTKAEALMSSLPSEEQDVIRKTIRENKGGMVVKGALKQINLAAQIKTLEILLELLSYLEQQSL